MFSVLIFAKIMIILIFDLEESAEYLKTSHNCHLRGAKRILAGCLTNGGLYVKLGQGMVSFNHLLPREYTQTLVVLQDKALPRKLNEV